MKKVLLLVLFVVSLSMTSYSQSISKRPLNYDFIYLKGKRFHFNMPYVYTRRRFTIITILLNRGESFSREGADEVVFKEGRIILKFLIRDYG